VTFGFVVALEAAIDRLVERAHGDRWTSRISPDRLKHLEDLLTQRKRTNSEIGLLECSNLDDRLTISEKNPEIWRSLGFPSRKQFAKTAKRIGDLRDVLAHGGDLLALDADPVEAVKVFVTIRDSPPHPPPRRRTPHPLHQVGTPHPFRPRRDPRLDRPEPPPPRPAP
jgi:hypothetical protein